jgi:hypothetical protein
MNLVFKKLNYKDQKVLHIINAPTTFEKDMGEMKHLVEIKTGLAGAKEVKFFMAFVTKQKEVDDLTRKITAVIAGDGVLWFVYPKGSSKKYTCEFNRDNGWVELGKQGFEPVRMVAIDEDWSALRFRRAENIKTMTRSSALSETGKKKVAASKKLALKKKTPTKKK